MSDLVDRRDIAATFPGGERRIAPVLREERRYQEFRAKHHLEDDPDSVALYLTALLDELHLSGGSLRHRLRLIDASYELDGRVPPSHDRSLRIYLRGLHQEAALGPTVERQPLYIEDVLALLDAIDNDRRTQTRDVALLLLANATGMTMRALRELTWNDVRLTRHQATLTVTPHGRRIGPHGRLVLNAQDWPQTLEALRSLRRQVGPAQGLLFGHVGQYLPALETLKLVVDQLPARNHPGRGGWSRPDPEPESDLEDRVAQLAQPSTRQLRDRAVIILGFSACLTNREAARLLARDVETTPQGLLLQVRQRAGPTAVPNGRRPQRAPEMLWQQWTARYAPQPSAPAFPQVYGAVPQAEALDKLGLRNVVQLHAQRAWLEGQYGFSSLRIGFLRTAVRQGVPESLILQHAGLRTLDGLAIHIRRERLISHSVLHLLGL